MQKKFAPNYVAEILATRALIDAALAKLNATKKKDSK